MHFAQFASEFAAFSLSIIAVFTFVLRFSQSHKYSSAMLDSLYGDIGEATDRVPSKNTIQYGRYWATKTFEKNIKGRRELNTSYLSNLFFSAIVNLCCCLRTCCNRVAWIRNGTNKNRKFKLGLERLSGEQDIQHLIEMNRVSRLLHKTAFLSR